MREPLLTERLVLRDVRVEDAELLLELDSDPEVLRFTGPRASTEVGWYRERIRGVFVPWLAHPWYGVRVVSEAASGEWLGWVFVRPATAARDAGALGWVREDEVEVGYRYRRSAWGRGFATEAARPLVQVALADPATAAVVACVRADHLASQRVLEKLGLERVGEVVLPGEDVPTLKLARGK